MRSILIINLFALAASSAFSQSMQLTVTDIDDDHPILTALFNAKVVMSPDSFLVGIWRPNFAEAQEFNVSYDSMCHTNIDTIIDYRSWDKCYTLIIFTTYDYVDSDFIIQNCHACAPDVSVAIFSQENDSSWKFMRMKKHLTRSGSWGHFGNIDLRKIGDNSYALAFTDGYGGQGDWEEMIILYE